ncbi:DUF4349 domain-containing protein [Iodobacter ciconiae]|uniref:DUF4349 domain-containing protein n=1 Tax=Iodobacter ciconiae TaxID=2496266 RepID=A0A3S8ZX23_9NEIS|nr:DUF4349 domain-containing protein [Iodobacter ciconiae]AZN38008.1 DUF4349 domain-containing protein [Iodobacter ciconiae]
MPAASSSAESGADSAPASKQLSSSANTYNDGIRQFIRTADAKFQVKDVYKSALTIEDITAQLGGFVEKNTIKSEIAQIHFEPAGDNTKLKLTEYTVNGILIIRVPSEKTQDFLRQIAGQIIFLNERTFTAQDAQLELLKQKLDIRRSQETQSQMGKAAKGSGNAEEKAIAIDAQDSSKQARDNAIILEKEFADQVAFSRITLSLDQASQVSQTEVSDTEAIFKQARPNFFYRLEKAIQSGWYWGLDTSIELMKIWPLWLVIAALVLLVRRFRKTKKTSEINE